MQTGTQMNSLGKIIRRNGSAKLTLYRDRAFECRSGRGKLDQCAIAKQLYHPPFGGPDRGRDD